MFDHLGRRRTVVLQHVLDEVDAAPRTVELVAKQHISRAGRGAEAAMHAGAQDLFGGVGVRVGELRGGEVRLHVLLALPHASRVEDAARVKTAFSPAPSVERARRLTVRTPAPRREQLLAPRPAWRVRPTISSQDERCRRRRRDRPPRHRGSARSTRRPNRSKIPPTIIAERSACVTVAASLGVGQSRQTMREPGPSSG